jgi:hypothetical protein
MTERAMGQLNKSTDSYGTEQEDSPRKSSRKTGLMEKFRNLQDSYRRSGPGSRSPKQSTGTI